MRFPKRDDDYVPVALERRGEWIDGVFTLTCSGCGAKGDRAEIRQYGIGLCCLACSPAVVAGRTVPIPDPTRTMAALIAQPRPPSTPRAYGPFDPRTVEGRTVECWSGNRFKPGGVVKEERPIPAGLIRQRAALCTAAYDRGRGL